MIHRKTNHNISYYKGKLNIINSPTRKSVSIITNNNNAMNVWIKIFKFIFKKRTFTNVIMIIVYDYWMKNPGLEATSQKIEKIIKGDPTLDIKKLQGYFNTPTYRLRVGEPNYIKDAKGKTIQVLLDMKSYDSMMNRIREFESIIKAGKSARKTKKPKVGSI